MITYDKGVFSLNLLARFHGSAVYRAMFFGVAAVGFYLVISYVWHDDEDVVDPRDREVQHPYALGVLVTSVTFLIVFRANQGYGRYWEATSNVFHMMSKWLDATTHSGIFHLQSPQYDKIKPPSFFKYQELDKYFLTRDRERGISSSSLKDSKFLRKRATGKSIEAVGKRTSYLSARNISSGFETGDDEPPPLTGKPRLDGGWGSLFTGSATFFSPEDDNWAFSEGFAGTKGGRTPPLFLQELAHLASLLNAVALSTLRNDVEGAESPLRMYVPGSPWPEVDPDNLDKSFKQTIPELIMHALGADRTPAQRTRYNASRPLPVLGGISDAEIRFLQMARGPSAKTQLCWNWLSEFIHREHLAGSMGETGSPIISRVMQFLGDGMIYYNHSRKIMMIPFPFPHAQLSVLYVLVMVLVIPLLLDQFIVPTWMGALITFFAVTCLAGLHEVARELENPFRNVPNELPLVTLQAMFNEGLITIYAGFHPDAYWDGDSELSAHHNHVHLERHHTPGSSYHESARRKLPEEDELHLTMQEENGPVPDGDDDLPSLREIIAKQGRELERLREMVELRPTKYVE
jgi:predicted membrane chloride channel (bestrophin family)